MYIIRKDSKTLIYLNYGRIVSTYIPAKTIVIQYECEDSLNINKGIFLNINYILYVNQNIYTMKDCTEFEERTRSTKSQKQIKHTLVKNPSHSDVHNIIQAKFSILDNSPIPYCVFEYSLKENKHILRYVNKAIEEVIECTYTDLFNQCSSNLFDERKTFETFKDVALNKAKARSIDNGLILSCYQPLKNYCACALIKK